MTFQRENRYIVVKLKDLDQDQEEGLRGVMYGYHIPTRECLVIESDWPEYEPAWRMIQARVEGATLSPAHIEDGVDTSAWPACNPACDPDFNGHKSRHCTCAAAKAALSAPHEQAELWAVHVEGPDDLYAAFSREDAERHASELNAIPTPDGISISAVVIPSPWGAVEHWQYLAEQEREHVESMRAALSAPPAAGVPDVGALIKRLQGCEPHLTDKVHYCSDDADDYRTYKLDLYIPTPARDPEPFEVAAARWLGAAPTPPQENDR